MRIAVLRLALAFGLLLPAVSAQEAQSPKPSLSDDVVELFKWRSIGPANMSGRITSIAVSEQDPNTWWAASASGGLLKTTNNGVTFEHQFDSEATVSIGDVQVSASNPDIVWVGTGESNPRNSSSWGDGVYKSVDGGKTWKNMGLKKIFQTGRLAIHPTNPDVVYVGALGRLWGPSEDRGLYKTTDGGKTWEKILYLDEDTGIIDVQMDPVNPDNLVVAAYERRRDGFDGNDPAVKFGERSGIYRTDNGGESFVRVTKGLPSVPMGRIGLNYFRGDPKHVYAVVESEKIGQLPETYPVAGIRGESVDVGSRITSVTKDGAAAEAGVQEGDLVVDVDGTRILNYGDLQAAIRRSAAEKTAVWTVIRDGETTELTLTYKAQPEPSEEERERLSRMRSNPRSPFSQSLGGQNQNLQDQQGEDGKDFGGIYHSADGGISWERINSLNPRPMYYSQIRVDPSDRNRIYVLGTSLYKSDDGGKTFTGDGHDGSVHVDHHALWIDPRDGRHIILGNDGGLYVTWDRMENWDHHNHIAIAQFYHVGVSADEDYYAYGGLQDNGSWGGPTRVADASGPMNSDWFRVGGGDGFICLVDPEDPNQIYFESQNGAMGRIHLETGDRGFIRPRAPRGTRYRFNWKTPFLLSPHNSAIHYSAGNHVFRSYSRGDSVEAISPEITLTDKGAGSAISESPRKAGVLYVGTTDGAVHGTQDGGKTWSNLLNPESEEEAETEDEATEENDDDDDEARPAEGRRGEGRGAGRGRMDPARLAVFLERFDKNGDGVISKDEAPEQMASVFARLDEDGDGKIVLADLKQDASADKTTASEAAASTAETPETSEQPQESAAAVEKPMTAEKQGEVDPPAAEEKPVNQPEGAADGEKGEAAAAGASEKPADPAPEQTAPVKPAAEEPAAEQPAAENPAPEKRPEEKPAEEKPVAEKPAEESAAEPNTAEPATDQPVQKPEEAAATDPPAQADGEKTDPLPKEDPPAGGNDGDSDPGCETCGPQDEEPAQDAAEEKTGAADEAASAKPEEEKTVEAATEESAAQEPTKATADPDSKAESSEESTVADDSLSGTWKGRFISEQMTGSDAELTLVIRMTGPKKITGSYSTARSEGDIESGEWNAEANTVILRANSDQSAIDFRGTVTGTQMSGSIEVNGGSFTLDFEAARSGAAPVATATEAAAQEAEAAPLHTLIPGPRWVSSLEASRYEDGRCYMTLDGHRSNDDEPYVFMTEDFGKTWKSIRANLPTEAGSTRVIREDIENEDLLYLGCEFSAWVSIDRGKSWTRLNSNLPTVAVHELAQHPTRGEIVAGTHGRALWILDVHPLRQMTAEALAEDVSLFEPSTIIRWRSRASRGSAGTRAFIGENPDAEARIYYSLGRNARSANLTVTTLTGDELLDVDVETRAGVHVHEWDMITSSGRRRQRVGTGEYLVTLRVDGKNYHQVLTVKSDPTLPESESNREEEEFLEALLGYGEEEGKTEPAEAAID